MGNPEHQGQQEICPTCKRPLGAIALTANEVEHATQLLFGPTGNPDDMRPGDYLSSRIPYGINDDGTVRYHD